MGCMHSKFGSTMDILVQHIRIVSVHIFVYSKHVTAIRHVHEMVLRSYDKYGAALPFYSIYKIGAKRLSIVVLIVIIIISILILTKMSKTKTEPAHYSVCALISIQNVIQNVVNRQVGAAKPHHKSLNVCVCVSK